MQTLTLGFSPCPNDTFIFDALVNGKIASPGLQFDTHLHDVEQLNILARESKPDVTKISFSNYPAISADYVILNAGGALGSGCGPLLISKKEYEISQVHSLSIAIPGIFTTANLLLSIFFHEALQKKEMLFSDIETAVLNDYVDAGLIIHENRFTYASRGLKKIADMGELWEKATGLPIPLGCIVIKRSLHAALQQQVNELIHQSILHAFQNPGGAMTYVAENALEMEEAVMKQHIDLYVNKFSLDLGAEGKKAIELLFKRGNELGLLPAVSSPLFLNKNS